MSNSESAEDKRRILHISEKEARAKLVEVFEVSGCVRPCQWIAVDLDDVMSNDKMRCRVCVASIVYYSGCSVCGAPDLLSRAGHNRRFGTHMQIKHFYCQSFCFRIVVITPIPTDFAGSLDLV